MAESFCVEVTHQLNKLLESEKIILGFPIQYRVKQWESLAKKFQSPSFPIKTVREVQDVAGLRIILLFKRDIATVADLIKQHLKVIRQYDTQERLKENEFGYTSLHFVVELPEAWLTVPTMAPMRGLIAEIQIRTIAQHIWAAASHTLQYKKKENVPIPVLRAIYRASALLETVDLEFERVLTEREEYRDAVDILSSEDKLNVDLIEKVLDSLFPEKSKSGDEYYADLLDELAAFNITTSNELKEVIKKNLDSIWREEKVALNIRINDIKQGKPLHGTTPDRMEKGVFYTHVGLARGALKSEFGDDYEEYLKEKTIRKMKEGKLSEVEDSPAE